MINIEELMKKYKIANSFLYTQSIVVNLVKLNKILEAYPMGYIVAQCVYIQVFSIKDLY